MTSRLLDLHERFIDQAQRPMSLGANPIEPQRPVPVLIAVDRWRKTGRGLDKRFSFRRPEDRTRFVTALMEYEEQVQHHAQMTLKEGEVSLVLMTKDVDRVTELDQEYARFADSVFKDIVYSP